MGDVKCSNCGEVRCPRCAEELAFFSKTAHGSPAINRCRKCGYEEKASYESGNSLP